MKVERNQSVEVLHTKVKDDGTIQFVGGVPMRLWIATQVASGMLANGSGVNRVWTRSQSLASSEFMASGKNFSEEDVTDLAAKLCDEYFARVSLELADQLIKQHNDTNQEKTA